MDLYEDEQLQSRSRDTHVSGAGCGMVQRAGRDHAVTADPRVLQHLVAAEKTCQVSPHFDRVQTDIQPYMRRLLAVWMFQVCMHKPAGAKAHINVT